MPSEKKNIWCLLAGVVWLALSSAAAQQPSPSAPAAPAPNEAPQRTTTTYADWVLTCETRAGAPQKTCEIVQLVQAQAQGKAVPFSTIIVMHPLKGQPVKLVIKVPTNVTLSTNVRIQIADADPGIAAPFARCATVGCIADFELSDDVLKKFRATSGTGKVTYADFTGREIAVPMSLKGFDQAIEALLKE